MYRYAGVEETLLNFVGSLAAVTAHQPAIAEIGCGTGHWLSVLTRSSWRPIGLEPSPAMLEHARTVVPGAPLVRARAEDLPWRDGVFDRIVCVNALHHFTDRTRFFAEALRVIRPGGGLLTVGKDPHAERDSWWVYDYFPETLEIDRYRFAPVRALRGELAKAGFRWAESFESDHIEVAMSAADALAGGVVHRSFTSQLSVLTELELQRGVERIRDADRKAGGALQLVADFRLFATIGWA